MSYRSATKPVGVDRYPPRANSATTHRAAAREAVFAPPLEPPAKPGLATRMVRATRRYLAACRTYVSEWHCRARSRAELTTLDDFELQDLRTTRGAAKFEAEKPFWRE